MNTSPKKLYERTATCGKMWTSKTLSVCLLLAIHSRAEKDRGKGVSQPLLPLKNSNIKFTLKLPKIGLIPSPRHTLYLYIAPFPYPPVDLRMTLVVRKLP